ncbi:vitamin-D-receptor interacting mediator subunit 4-domain-containing protein [Achaetomium macrosporum]|uniref:Mediator of RNA polymerase II transcription subunit 4 n=1 Tax=Achaetomium macrosporum TaxID=79813 RepID=A0AAN7H7G8_9PEZI|nr:vitamin-D-receptor interacting mediator subunit 4-domain-containing protein [Achaetomium macrosporum]
MEKDLDGRFERLEKALNNMIDSVVKNNPSEQLAEELVAAQDDVMAGLKLLETHQNNYARIQQLRREVSRYDDQIKDIINSLWQMRKELVAVTATPPGGSKYQFTTEELLTFARQISRKTLPLPGVLNSYLDANTARPAEPESQTAQTPNTSFNFGLSNASIGTPGPMSASTPNTAANDTTTQQTSQLPPSQPYTKPPTTEEKLPAHLKPAVNPLLEASFQPWPTAEQIRSGALADIQRLVDKGIDPKNYDPAEEERKRVAEEQAKKEAEEQARREREEAERRMREERERMARERERARQMEAVASGAGGRGAERRDSVAVGMGRAANKPKQFTFLGADDDDEDDEDD